MMFEDRGLHLQIRTSFPILKDKIITNVTKEMSEELGWDKEAIYLLF